MNVPETFTGWVVFLLQQYGGVLLKGALVTLFLAITGTLVGCLIGLLVGAIQTIPEEETESAVSRAALKALKKLLYAYVEVFRGTPMIVQAMVVYYGAMSIFNLDMSPLFAGFFVVSINTGAYMAETVRGGILSVDPGQKEGAKAIGMTHLQTMLYVVLPQALRNIMPQIGNNLIINIKDTCVLSIIGTVELFFTFKSISGALYTYFEAATVTLIIYFILTFTCSRILRAIERKMDGPADYDLASTDTLEFTSGMTTYDAKSGRNL